MEGRPTLRQRRAMAKRQQREQIHAQLRAEIDMERREEEANRVCDEALFPALRPFDGLRAQGEDFLSKKERRRQDRRDALRGFN